MFFFRIGLPLFPAKVISTSEYQEETQNGQKNDTIACHYQATGAPLDLQRKTAISFIHGDISFSVLSGLPF